jgi:signal transduction histidine kinase
MQAHTKAIQHLMRMPSTTMSAPSASHSAARPWSVSRASFLADASKRLSASLDLEAVMRCMAELGVPQLGSASLICMVDDAGAVTHVSAKHLDPHRRELVSALGRPSVRDTRGWQPIVNVALTRRPVALSQLATAVLLGGALTPHSVVSDLGLKTALIVPVIDRGAQRTLAVLAFFSERARHYGSSQIRLAEDLASRFALALEAAAMYRACQVALEDRQETLATTVHDLMSPLTYIKGTAQRLQRIEDTIADSDTREEFRRRLEAIDSAVSRMASALDGLLQTSTPPRQAGMHRDVACQVTDLVDVAQRIVAEQQLLAGRHCIRVRESPTSLAGTWNTDRIERMLGNLIGNAVKYSAPGTVVDVSLSCEVDGEGRWAVLRVLDQGVGIPAGDLPFVFEPFHRGSNVGEIGGTGLGLASVWQTVKTHDGRLWVDSEEGKGTCVTVCLPLEVHLTPATSTPR